MTGSLGDCKNLIRRLPNFNLGDCPKAWFKCQDTGRRVNNKVFVTWDAHMSLLLQNGHSIRTACHTNGHTHACHTNGHGHTHHIRTACPICYKMDMLDKPMSYLPQNGHSLTYSSALQLSHYVFLLLTGFLR